MEGDEVAMVQSVELTASQIWQLLNARLVQDSISRGLEIISTPHAEVHDGDTFTACYKTPDASPIANDATVVLLIKVGSTKQAHLVWGAAFGGEGEVQLFEGPNDTADGNPLTEPNMNRGSAEVAEVTVFQGPTIGNGVGNGTELVDVMVPGGTTGRAVGSALRANTEWMLAKSTNYLLVLTNRAGNAQQASAQLQWYEHA